MPAPPAAGAPGRALLLADYGEDDPPWVRELVARLVTPQTPRCRHLRRRPDRAGVLSADEGVARCQGCNTRRLDSPPTGTFAGRLRCGGCSGLFEPEQVTPLCIPILPWVLYVAICARCEAALAAGKRRPA